MTTIQDCLKKLNNKRLTESLNRNNFDFQITDLSPEKEWNDGEYIYYCCIDFILTNKNNGQCIKGDTCVGYDYYSNWIFDDACEGFDFYDCEGEDDVDPTIICDGACSLADVENLCCEFIEANAQEISDACYDEFGSSDENAADPYVYDDFGNVIDID